MTQTTATTQTATTATPESVWTLHRDVAARWLSGTALAHSSAGMQVVGQRSLGWLNGLPSLSPASAVGRAGLRAEAEAVAGAMSTSPALLARLGPSARTMAVADLADIVQLVLEQDEIAAEEPITSEGRPARRAQASRAALTQPAAVKAVRRLVAEARRSLATVAPAGAVQADHDRGAGQTQPLSAETAAASAAAGVADTAQVQPAPVPAKSKGRRSAKSAGTADTAANTAGATPAGTAAAVSHIGASSSTWAAALPALLASAGGRAWVGRIAPQLAATASRFGPTAVGQRSTSGWPSTDAERTLLAPLDGADFTAAGNEGEGTAGGALTVPVASRGRKVDSGRPALAALGAAMAMSSQTAPARGVARRPTLPAQAAGAGPVQRNVATAGVGLAQPVGSGAGGPAQFDLISGDFVPARSAAPEGTTAVTGQPWLAQSWPVAAPAAGNALADRWAGQLAATVGRWLGLRGQPAAPQATRGGRAEAPGDLLQPASDELVAGQTDSIQRAGAGHRGPIERSESDRGSAAGASAPAATGAGAGTGAGTGARTGARTGAVTGAGTVPHLPTGWLALAGEQLGRRIGRSLAVAAPQLQAGSPRAAVLQRWQGGGAPLQTAATNQLAPKGLAAAATAAGRAVAGLARRRTMAAGLTAVPGGLTAGSGSVLDLAWADPATAAYGQLPSWLASAVQPPRPGVYDDTERTLLEPAADGAEAAGATTGAAEQGAGQRSGARGDLASARTQPVAGARAQSAAGPRQGATANAAGRPQGDAQVGTATAPAAAPWASVLPPALRAALAQIGADTSTATTSSPAAAFALRWLRQSAPALGRDAAERTWLAALAPMATAAANADRSTAATPAATARASGTVSSPVPGSAAKPPTNGADSVVLTGLAALAALGRPPEQWNQLAAASQPASAAGVYAQAGSGDLVQLAAAEDAPAAGDPSPTDTSARASGGLRSVQSTSAALAAFAPAGLRRGRDLLSLQRRAGGLTSGGPLGAAVAGTAGGKSWLRLGSARGGLRTSSGPAAGYSQWSDTGAGALIGLGGDDSASFFGDGAPVPGAVSGAERLSAAVQSRRGSAVLRGHAGAVAASGGQRGQQSGTPRGGQTALQQLAAEASGGLPSDFRADSALVQPGSASDAVRQAGMGRGATAAGHASQAAGMARVLSVTSEPASNMLPLVAPMAQAIVQAAAAKPLSESIVTSGADPTGGMPLTSLGRDRGQGQQQEAASGGQQDAGTADLDALASKIARSVMVRLKRERERRGQHG